MFVVLLGIAPATHGVGAADKPGAVQGAAWLKPNSLGKIRAGSFHPISQRHEKTSPIITTNLSFAEWVAVFGDPNMSTALLDRIIHPCDIPEAGSDAFRFKQRKNSPNGVPDMESFGRF